MLREKCNCGICVACRSFFKCTDLHRVNVLQLAVNSADDGVNGNCGGGGEGEKVGEG